MADPTDPNTLIATLDGEFGDEAQYEAMVARGKELIALAFSLVRLMPADGVAITPGKQQFIYLTK